MLPLFLELFSVFCYITCSTSLNNAKIYGIYYTSAAGPINKSSTFMSCLDTKELTMISQVGNFVRFASSENLMTQVNFAQSIGLKVIVPFSLKKYVVKENQIWQMELSDFKQDFLEFVMKYRNYTSVEMIVIGDIYDPVLSEDFQRGVPLAAYRNMLLLFSQMLGSAISNAKSLNSTHIALGISGFMDPFVLSTIIKHVSVDYFIINMYPEHLPYPGFFEVLINQGLIMQFTRSMENDMSIKNAVNSYIGIGAADEMWWNNSISGIIYEEFSDQHWRAIDQSSDTCSNRYAKEINYRPCNRGSRGLVENSHITNCMNIKPDLLAFAGCYNCVFPDKTLCTYSGDLKYDTSSICFPSCMEPLEEKPSLHEAIAAIVIFVAICLTWAVVHWKDKRKAGEQQALDQYMRVQSASIQPSISNKKYNTL